jgi:hypothetical protein
MERQHLCRPTFFHPLTERAVYGWLANWNDKPKPFIWKATADVILDEARRCNELTGPAH